MTCSLTGESSRNPGAQADFAMQPSATLQQIVTFLGPSLHSSFSLTSQHHANLCTAFLLTHPPRQVTIWSSTLNCITGKEPQVYIWNPASTLALIYDLIRVYRLYYPIDHLTSITSFDDHAYREQKRRLKRSGRLKELLSTGTIYHPAGQQLHHYISW